MLYKGRLALHSKDRIKLNLSLISIAKMNGNISFPIEKLKEKQNIYGVFANMITISHTDNFGITHGTT